MKIFAFVICLIIPFSDVFAYKLEVSEESFTEEELVTTTTSDSITEREIDVDIYRGPLQNLPSTIPKDAALKQKFNGISYEVLTTTNNGARSYLTLDYAEAAKACAASKPKSRSLLTFKSAKDNAFVAKWLFSELKIVTQVWTSLTRVTGTNDFVWADGTKLTQKNEKGLFKNWDKCEPNDITATSWGVPEWGENCVEIYSAYYPYPQRCDVVAKVGQWNDIPCTQIYNIVVCQEADEDSGNEVDVEEFTQSSFTEEQPPATLSIDQAIDTIPQALGGFLQFWGQHFETTPAPPTIAKDEDLKTKFNGISYEVLTTTGYFGREYLALDYAEASKACAASTSKPRSLLTFKSAKDNEFVTKWLFSDLKIDNKVWTSLTRVNRTSDFIWPDGTKITKKNEEGLFKNWDKCEPNDFTSEDWGEDCVEMYSTTYPYPQRCDVLAKAGQWNDIPCTFISNIVVCQGVDENSDIEVEDKPKAVEQSYLTGEQPAPTTTANSHFEIITYVEQSSNDNGRHQDKVTYYELPYSYGNGNLVAICHEAKEMLFDISRLGPNEWPSTPSRICDYPAETSPIPEDKYLKTRFNGISYEILTFTMGVRRGYAVMNYVKASEACAASKPKSRSLLTFKSAEDNAFVANWLSNDLKINIGAWTSLIRIAGTNDFVWADGTKITQEKSVYQNWLPVDGDCVKMVSGYLNEGTDISKFGYWKQSSCEDTSLPTVVVCQEADEDFKNEVIQKRKV